MPHSVRSEDDGDGIPTSRPASLAAPASAPTQSTSTNGAGTTITNNYAASIFPAAAAPAQSLPTTIIFARGPVPARGRNGGGVSLLSVLLSAPIGPPHEHGASRRAAPPAAFLPFSAPPPAGGVVE
ncbi:hypothetical protein MMYC01_207715, partial [Madurella mycetomatis]